MQVKDIGALAGQDLIVSVKLRSGGYMDVGGLRQDEAFEQLKWLTECGVVDFVVISGGNAEQKMSKLHDSFDDKILDKVPQRKSTRMREAAFIKFTERVENSRVSIPIQLFDKFRSRQGWLM